MLKKLIALAGIAVFLGGISLIVFLNQSKSQALAKDDTDKKFGIISSDTPPCTWTVDLPQRVLSESKSQSIIINTKNETDQPCESYLSLVAPGFDATPPKTEQLLSAKSKSPGSLVWVLSPRKSGDYELAISDGLTTETRGVKVTNTLGLSATQVQVLGMITPIFGPMFTLPWWFDKWQQRKNRSKNPPPTPPTA